MSTSFGSSEKMACPGNHRDGRSYGTGGLCWFLFSFFFIKKRKRSSLYKYTRTRFGVVGYGRLNRLIKYKKDLFPATGDSLALSLSLPSSRTYLYCSLVLALVNDPLAGRNSESCHPLSICHVATLPLDHYSDFVCCCFISLKKVAAAAASD